MRFLIILLLLIEVTFAARVFQGEEFVLELGDDEYFKLYPKEASLQFNFSGVYIERNDSLILTTHEVGNEVAILATYNLGEFQLSNSYVQPTFESMLPQEMYLREEIESNGHTTELFWHDFASMSFTLYSFSPEKWILSITPYDNKVKNGKELVFFDNAFGAVKEEINYVEGQLSGKCYKYEPLDESYSKVQLVQIDTYKEGSLMKSKRPEVPPVFYTSHF